MKKFLLYSLGVIYSFFVQTVGATEKFEVLPDLPEPLSYAVQPVNAAAITGATDVATMGAQSIGNEPSVISVVLSLLFVVVLIYLTGVIYAKLNKVGFKTLRRQQGDISSSQVTVLSTTALGSNKTLHVVELDGKRMLIGASSGAIHLIKDLGSFDKEFVDEEYSHIEIPNIKIPKIEIPTIKFSRLSTKTHKPIKDIEVVNENSSEKNISSIRNEIDDNVENSEGIIDSLFSQQAEPIEKLEDDNTKLEHIVDPDDYALYKKYLG